MYCYKIRRCSSHAMFLVDLSGGAFIGKTLPAQRVVCFLPGGNVANDE